MIKLMKYFALLCVAVFSLSIGHKAHADHNKLLNGFLSGDNYRSHLNLALRDVTHYHGQTTQRFTNTPETNKALIADALNRNIIKRIAVIDAVTPEMSATTNVATSPAVGYVDIEPLFYDLSLRDKQLFSRAFSDLIKGQSPDLAVYYLRDGSKIIGSHSRFGLNLY